MSYFLRFDTISVLAISYEGVGLIRLERSAKVASLTYSGVCFLHPKATASVVAENFNLMIYQESKIKYMSIK